MLLMLLKIGKKGTISLPDLEKSWVLLGAITKILIVEDISWSMINQTSKVKNFTKKIKLSILWEALFKGILSDK